MLLHSFSHYLHWDQGHDIALPTYMVVFTPRLTQYMKLLHICPGTRLLGDSGWCQADIQHWPTENGLLLMLLFLLTLLRIHRTEQGSGIGGLGSYASPCPKEVINY